MTDDHNNPHTTPPVRVTPVHATLRTALMNLRVHPEQTGYVGRISDLLADAAQCPACEPMAILCGDSPVGYYRIEPNARSVTGHDFELPALGLRSFFIDAGWQGRGLASQALQAMVTDLVKRHPQARRLVLTVNCRNKVAVRLYLRHGFIDDGQLYHGGPSGPQHLLWRPLP